MMNKMEEDKTYTIKIFFNNELAKEYTKIQEEQMKGIEGFIKVWLLLTSDNNITYEITEDNINNLDIFS